MVQNYTDNIFILRVVLLTVKDSTSELIIASIVFQLRAKSYDKRDDFNFHIVNFPFIWSNSPAASAYEAYISLLYMFIKDVHDVWLLTLQYHEYWWTSFQHFKVPVFREILPPSKQNRMMKTRSPQTILWMNISRSIYIQTIFKSKSNSLKLFCAKLYI